MNKLAIPERYLPYYRLMRVDRPIGTLLLLWPTYLALLLAAEGIPSVANLIIFTSGVFLMRSAGCVINDYADRRVDGHVERTANRPIVNGSVSPQNALRLFVALVLLAFIAVLFTNQFTIVLSVGALCLASLYPFMKRFTHLPQVVLGAAFAWAVPMAFAAETGEVQPGAWLLYSIVVLWAVIYDTFYAMTDLEDDIKVGVKSTAVLFGDLAPAITAIMQVLMLVMLVMLGNQYQLAGYYYVALVVITLLFGYQQFLVRSNPSQCFAAFLNNQWVGLTLLLGVALELLL